MHKSKSLFGGVLAGTIVLSEISGSAEWQQRPQYLTHFTLSATLPAAVPDNPHTHLEADAQFFDVSSEYFASGGQRVVGRYELYLKPYFDENDDEQGAVAWVDAVGTPDGLSGPQCMYARFRSTDEVLNALASKLDFPQERIESIRKAVSKGLTKIGGSHAPVRFFFSESQLVELGMSFQPLDG